MSTITFDSLELVKKLRESGISQDQAEAIVSAISAAQDRLVTKQDLEIAIAPLRWMLITVVSGVVSLVLKTFF